MRNKETVCGQQPAVLMAASVASMIGQFNMQNICLLLDLGYEVHVACNFQKGNTCDARAVRALRTRLRQMHVRCHQWDCPRSLSAVADCARAYRQMERLLERVSFDWIHCHSPIGGALARAAAHRIGVGVVYTAHGFHFYKGAPFWNWLAYYPVEKLLARWTDVLVTVNREDERFARRHLRAGHIRRIPGVGIAPDRIRKQVQTAPGACWMHRALESSSRRDAFCRKYQIPDKAKVLLSVGELSRRKNHQAVLKALAGLMQEDVYYIICGQGVMEQALWKQARKLGIAHRVRMPGYVEDVADLYEQADLFVFPSLQEGLPVALMEAMAAGLACVASDIRGNRELIDDRGGGLVPPKSPGQLLEKLRELLADPERRELCGSYNQRKIEAYRFEKVQRRMRCIYGIMAKPKAQACLLHHEKEKCPEVSVIMAVFHAGDGQALRQAVASICGQSYTDWELLICDDGSKDQTWEMLAKLAAADPRIRLIRLRRNRKAGFARNRCIRAARGRYVAVMDADDLSAKERLARQVSFLETHAAFDFVGSRGEFFVSRIGDDGEQYPYWKSPEAEDFLFSLPYVHASILFRREALERVRGYDSGRLAVRVEDYDLLLRMYAAGLRGANLDEVLYYIRRDREQYRRRKYRYRFHEALVKYRGFCRLGLMPEGILYAAKPLLVGLLPVSVLKRLQRYYYGAKGGCSYGKHRHCHFKLSGMGTKPSVHRKYP